MRPQNLLRFPAVNISTLRAPLASSSPVGFFGFIVDNCVNSTPPLPLSHANAVRYFRITADGLCKNNPWVIYRVPLDKWLSLARYIKRFL